MILDNKNNVIMTMEEYTALINEFKALQHKYGDICDRYRLCKDANETLKQNVVIARTETEEKVKTIFNELYMYFTANSLLGLPNPYKNDKYAGLIKRYAKQHEVEVKY